MDGSLQAQASAHGPQQMSLVSRSLEVAGPECQQQETEYQQSFNTENSVNWFKYESTSPTRWHWETVVLDVQLDTVKFSN